MSVAQYVIKDHFACMFQALKLQRSAIGSHSGRMLRPFKLPLLNVLRSFVVLSFELFARRLQFRGYRTHQSMRAFRLMNMEHTKGNSDMFQPVYPPVDSEKHDEQIDGATSAGF